MHALGFRSYTGTGECLDDYRHRSESPSLSSDELATPAPRHSVSGPPGSSNAESDGMEGGSFFGWGAAAAEQPIERHRQNTDVEPQGLRTVTANSPLGSSFSLPSDLRWFERQRSVIYADSLGLDEFVDLVRCLQASRRALLGGEGIVAPEEEIAVVFLPLASKMPDGSRRMMLKDFKRAVQSSPRFLWLLGVPSNQIFSPALDPGKSNT